MATNHRLMSRLPEFLLSLLALLCIVGFANVGSARETRSNSSCAQVIKRRFTLRCRQTAISDNVERSGKKVANWLAYQLKLKKQRSGKIHVFIESTYLFLDRDFKYTQKGDRWLIDLTDANHLELQDASLNIQWTNQSAEVTFTHRHPLGPETVRFTCPR